MENNRFFPEIHGNFGFGCMRLPMQGQEIDYAAFSAMIDAFLEAGFNYFDTAHGYHGGASEIAISQCLSKRHDRSEFLLTDKLTEPYFHRQEDIRPFVLEQLRLCGVDYFDFYLMHAQDAKNYKHFQKCRAYETAFALKAEGLLRHVGISFHDKAEVLDRILTEHPEIEIVQIQFNYVDYDSETVESRKCYEVCKKHGKPVIVMEPVKGGSLVNLPEEADRILRELRGGSNASYAVRFAASFPQMAMVLSGMSNMEQMRDNIASMRDFRPLNAAEMDAVAKVSGCFRNLDLIPCTACRYCIEENACPKGIRIPELFAMRNAYKAFRSSAIRACYSKTLIDSGKASDCIKCGKCEKVCPQHLEIRKLLADVAAVFE